jgi:hypothetical protein
LSVGANTEKYFDRTLNLLIRIGTTEWTRTTDPYHVKVGFINLVKSTEINNP